MDSSIKTSFIWGKDLTTEDFNTLNSKRAEIFGKQPWDYVNNNFFLERLFAILKRDNQIVSFAMLIPVELHIDKNKYSIWGVSTVASLEQGKGYGKILMNSIKDFSTKDNKIIVGSCDAKNTEFYRKSGCEIWEDGRKNFVYITEDGEHQLDIEGIVYFYIDDYANTIKNARSNNKMIYHHFPHW